MTEIVVAVIPTIGFVVGILVAQQRWLHEQKTLRDERIRTDAARYILPFLTACEELQSRLYNLLEQNAIPVLRDHYGEGEYAEETLHLVAQYFGWEAHVFRFGPYSNDEEVIRLTERLRNDFATSAIGNPVLRFFRSEQRGLGRLGVRRIGEDGSEFETVPVSEFRDRMKEERHSRTLSISRTLEGLRQANDVANLSGKPRMLRIQNSLVDLLEYLEPKAGYSLFKGKGDEPDRDRRKKAVTSS